jgi:hypothetical protein
MDLQKRSHPTDKVPVILPFLADAILALGGTRSEGIFRIPGDGDSVSELKSRIDRGNYELVSGFDVRFLVLVDALLSPRPTGTGIVHSKFQLPSLRATAALS